MLDPAERRLHTLNKTDIFRKSFPFNAAIFSHRILCGCQLSQRVLHLMAGPFCMSWSGMGGLCTLGHRTEPEKSLPVEHELGPPQPPGGAKLKELLTSPSWPAKEGGPGLHLVKVAVETAPGWPRQHSCKFPLAAVKLHCQNQSPSSPLPTDSRDSRPQWGSRTDGISFSACFFFFSFCF